MSSVYAIIFLCVVVVALAVVAYIMRPRATQPAQMVESYYHESDSEEDDIEMFTPSCDTPAGCSSGAQGAHLSNAQGALDNDDCCGCARLSSDLTFYCGGSGRSLCRYPIDLPKPDEPSKPSICKLSGGCGDSTCMDTLKFDLQ